MNTMPQPDKDVATRPMGFVSLFVLSLVLILALAVPGCYYGISHYITASSKDFSKLLQQNKYNEARLLSHQTTRYLPGGLKANALNKFQQALRQELDSVTGEFVAHRIDYPTVNNRFDSIEKAGLYSDEMARYRAIVRTEQLVNKSDPREALNLVTDQLKIYPGDRFLTAKSAELQKEIQELEPYSGPIQHIFFHPLIAYPELAFDGDRKSQGLNEYMVTVSEFKKMIDSLYSNNYILVNPGDIFETRTENGKKNVIRREILLPRGKKPVVISIDDMNYYPYMIVNGMVYKLILDGDGEIAAYSRDTLGQEIISRDNEVVPILDRFVSEHPDFSYCGAKGVIALTGFDGVLGYRTNQLNSPTFPQEKKEALVVIKRLKETGWTFASHGYGHLNTPKVSFARLVADTQKWQAEVGSLVGPTDVYIYPYGAKVLPNDPKFKYLQAAGFDAFCSVGPREYTRFGPNYLLMDRRHMDGIALLSQPDTLTDLFDPKQVTDPVRPPL